jgi:hypothetical protein
LDANGTTIAKIKPINALVMFVAPDEGSPAPPG